MTVTSSHTQVSLDLSLGVPEIARTTHLELVAPDKNIVKALSDRGLIAWYSPSTKGWFIQCPLLGELYHYSTIEKLASSWNVQPSDDYFLECDRQVRLKYQAPPFPFELRLAPLLCCFGHDTQRGFLSYLPVYPGIITRVAENPFSGEVYIHLENGNSLIFPRLPLNKITRLLTSPDLPMLIQFLCIHSS